MVKRVLRRAFDVWETQSPLKFVYKPRGKADIEILFAKGAHGDGEPFDGKGESFFKWLLIFLRLCLHKLF